GAYQLDDLAAAKTAQDSRLFRTRDLRHLDDQLEPPLAVPAELERIPATIEPRRRPRPGGSSRSTCGSAIQGGLTQRSRRWRCWPPQQRPAMPGRWRMPKRPTSAATTKPPSDSFVPWRSRATLPPNSTSA